MNSGGSPPRAGEYVAAMSPLESTDLQMRFEIGEDDLLTEYRSYGPGGLKALVDEQRLRIKSRRYSYLYRIRRAILGWIRLAETKGAEFAGF